MTRRRLLYLGAILVQIGVIGALVANEEMKLAFGSRVELEVVGRDPLDPLAGAYQDIDLAIERLPLSLGRPGESAARGDRVFVSLRMGENGHVASGYGLREPSPESDLYLRGRVVAVDDAEIRVEYGLSRYYVPFDAADPTLEERPRLRVVVFVTADGRGTIEDLLVDGVPFDEWNRSR